MKALTLKQPWAWAVAHAGKDVENRTWRPPSSIIGQCIAIHAGMEFDKEAASHRGIRNSTLPDEFEHGAIVAVSRILTYQHETGFPRGPGRFPKSDRAYWWFTGPYGWWLTRTITLPEPIPCKGAQGLWDVPPEIEAEINRQVKK
jgi:hypothetical protein